MNDYRENYRVHWTTLTSVDFLTTNSRELTNHNYLIGLFQKVFKDQSIDRTNNRSNKRTNERTTNQTISQAVNKLTVATNHPFIHTYMTITSYQTLFKSQFIYFLNIYFVTRRAELPDTRPNSWMTSATEQWCSLAIHVLPQLASQSYSSGRLKARWSLFGAQKCWKTLNFRRYTLQPAHLLITSLTLQRHGAVTPAAKLPTSRCA